MIRRTSCRITRTDFQILYGAYVRPLLEYANPVVCSGRTKDVILIGRVQRAATKMVAGLTSMDYETRLAVLDLFPLEDRRLRGDLILTYALFEQGLANRFFTVDPANTRRGHDQVATEVRISCPIAPNLKTVTHCREYETNEMNHQELGRTFAFNQRRDVSHTANSQFVFDTQIGTTHKVKQIR
ncbi:hypothetical protein CLF_104610 [Clonorchis sinensis]|uniref:Pol-related protein n=1 Tax=Clonorchis sinensis TaxID=79923 RepID=G7YNW4_CLOSI|nr:hypothetical protein CLF_104610 [Clonorchis sinensis]